MRVGLLAAAFRPAFWFARKRYHIYRADSEVILGAKLLEPGLAFEFRCISLANANGSGEFIQIDAALSEFLSDALRITIRKAMRLGGTLVVAIAPTNGQIAACRVIYSETAERNILALRDDELYVGNAYTQPSYRGLGLQATTLQQGLKHLRAHDKLKRTVTAIVRPDNEASLRGLAKVGFRIEGGFIEQRLFRFVRLIRGSDGGHRFARMVFGSPL